MVANLCREMASAVFDEAMACDNSLFRACKKSHPGRTTEQLRKIFVRGFAPRLVGDARATLAEMLTRPIDDSLKDSIYDALLKDASFRLARTRQERRIFVH